VVHKDLPSVEDKAFTLLSVSRDGRASNGKFQSQPQLNGCIDYGIEAEDLLLVIWVLRVTTDSDSGIHIGREFRAAKGEGICVGAVIQDDFGDHRSLDDYIESSFLELLFEAEDLIEDAGFVGIGLLKAKGQYLHFGSFDMGWKPMGRALREDSNFLAGDESCWISKAVEDPLTDVMDNAFELDKLAFLAEIRAAFVSGICGEEGSVGGNDLKREETQEIGDVDEGMKNTIIQGFTQAIFEIGECALARDKRIADAGIEPVVFPLERIPQHVNKGFHVGIFFDVAEKFQQEETDRVIGEAGSAILVGNDRSDKREIYQGRYKSGKSTDNPAVGVNLNVSTLVGIFR
jgi:hypothetical protein